MKIYAELEAEDFLEKNRFPVVKRDKAKTQEQAIKVADKLKYPVTMKIIGKNILHKSDVGGVILDIRNEQQLIKSFKKIKKIKGFQAVHIQKFIPGHWILIGLKKDPTFQHVITLAYGGIYTEIIKDTTFRILPIKNKDAENMINELKFYKILKGARGQKKSNIKALEKIIIKTANLAKKYKKIKELDINPLVLNSKQGIIVDARIIFE